MPKSKEQKKIQQKQSRPPTKQKPKYPIKELAPENKVDHLSWADLIVDYILRLGVVFYQEEDSKEEKNFLSAQAAFHIYMQHSLRVYYLHRLLFSLTCYGKHIQREFKLIDSGQIHDIFTKRGKKSLCQFLSYEAYDAVLATTEEIVKTLPQNILQALKKTHELKTALKPRKRLEIASLFKLVERNDESVQPVGQLFIQGTPLYQVLFFFHESLIYESLTKSTNVVQEQHFTLVKDFFLPAIKYVYHLSSRKPDTKRQTDQVILKGTLDYNMVENHYRNYLDLLVLLCSLCGETLLAKQHPKKMQNFVKRCHFDLRNKVAHEAKINFGAEFLLQLAQQANQLVKKTINWQEVVSMPDVALVQEEIETGFKKTGHFNLFRSAPSPSKPIDVIVSYLKPSFSS